MAKYNIWYAGKVMTSPAMNGLVKMRYQTHKPFLTLTGPNMTSDSTADVAMLTWHYGVPLLPRVCRCYVFVPVSYPASQQLPQYELAKNGVTSCIGGWGVACVAQGA